MDSCGRVLEEVPRWSFRADGFTKLSFEFGLMGDPFHRLRREKMGHRVLLPEGVPARNEFSGSSPDVSHGTLRSFVFSIDRVHGTYCKALSFSLTTTFHQPPPKCSGVVAQSPSDCVGGTAETSLAVVAEALQVRRRLNFVESKGLDHFRIFGLIVAPRRSSQVSDMNGSDERQVHDAPADIIAPLGSADTGVMSQFATDSP